MPVRAIHYGHAWIPTKKPSLSRVPITGAPSVTGVIREIYGYGEAFGLGILDGAGVHAFGTAGYYQRTVFWQIETKILYS